MTEIDLGVIKCAGDNNTKILPKSKKNSWEWTYVSTGRHLVRMAWLLNFYSSLFDIFVNTKIEANKAARTSYDIGFAPHHPWILRKSIRLGLLVIPDRDVVFKAANIKDENELKSASDAFKIVSSAIDEFLIQHDLKGLP